jgi:DNA-binding response OmpR family regulator
MWAPRLSANASGMSTEMINQPRCLIVEDQALIAMSLETYLEEAGINVQTVGSIAQARAWLAAHTADIAILDLMLQDGSANELAGELSRHNMPFVIYSGYPRSQITSCELQEAPWLEKPTRREDLLEVVLKTLMTLSGQVLATPKLHS